MPDITIKELRARSGMSQAQFAARFQIPVRTLQDWEQEHRVPPGYVVVMIQRIMELEDEACKSSKTYL